MITEHRPAGYFTAPELLESILDDHSAVGFDGKSTGFKQLDELLKIKLGEFTIVHGVPSHGKSAFLDHLVYNLNALHEWPAGFISFECLPIELHAQALIEIETETPFRSTQKKTGLDQESVKKATERLGKRFFFYQPDDRHMTLEVLMAEAALLKSQYGVKVIVVDPWNCIDHTRTKSDASATESEYIGRCLSRMKLFAAVENIHLFLVAHPTKVRPVKPDDPTPVPKPYDIAGSAAFFSKPDNIICVYRHDTGEETDPVDVHVQKVKYKNRGKRGVVAFTYDRNCGRYAERDQDHESA